MSCIFCRVIAGEIESKKIYEDENFVVIRDIKPAAPVHSLIIPRQHFAWDSDKMGDYCQLLGKIFVVAPQIAKELRVHGTGYKLVVNCGEGAGQTIEHFHVHLLGGWKGEVRHV